MTQGTDERAGWKRWGAGLALAATGMLAGGVIASGLPASAETTAATTAATSTTADSSSSVDESKSRRSDESLLSGDTASKVRAAALAKYPGATIDRVETDSDGVYEAHLTTAAGERVTVELGKDFAVTGTEAGGGHGGGHRG
jgi:hypothetical protein